MAKKIFSEAKLKEFVDGALLSGPVTNAQDDDVRFSATAGQFCAFGASSSDTDVAKRSAFEALAAAICAGVPPDELYDMVEEPSESESEPLRVINGSMPDHFDEDHDLKHEDSEPEVDQHA